MNDWHLRPKKNGRRCENNIFKCISSLKNIFDGNFTEIRSQGPIRNNPTLLQKLAPNMQQAIIIVYASLGLNELIIY